MYIFLVCETDRAIPSLGEGIKRNISRGRPEDKDADILYLITLNRECALLAYDALLSQLQVALGLQKVTRPPTFSFFTPLILKVTSLRVSREPGSSVRLIGNMFRCFTFLVVPFPLSGLSCPSAHCVRCCLPRS